MEELKTIFAAIGIITVLYLCFVFTIETIRKCSFLVKYKNRYKHSKEPRYSFETAKQIIFDCIMELEYHNENLSDSHIAAKLNGVLTELDKMEVVEGNKNEGI